MVAGLVICKQNIHFILETKNKRFNVISLAAIIKTLQKFKHIEQLYH